MAGLTDGTGRMTAAVATAERGIAMLATAAAPNRCEGIKVLLLSTFKESMELFTFRHMRWLP